MLSNKSRCHSAITIKLRLGTFFLILSQKLLEAPSKGQEMNVHREEFRDVEREVVANSDITQPVSDQIVQPQNKFLTPVIWDIVKDKIILFSKKEVINPIRYTKQ
jgi:hypothetical protein